MPRYQTAWPGPPAPLVSVNVGWVTTGSVPIRGILDTGADQTQIPETIARALRLRRISDVLLRSADGSVGTCPIYVADIEFEGMTFPTVSVVGSPLPIALIGRDLLNELRAEFDGPGLTFAVARPVAS